MSPYEQGFFVFYIIIFFISLVFIQEDSKKNGFTGPAYILPTIIVAVMWPIYYIFMMIRLWSHWRKRLKHPWLNE
ncbi:MAG: hypothetical protein H8D23_16675 [Candidatus Brocadiales bacterium]|nr:hypothetical protein [Candidatus Brocadiales bacterium]